MMSPSRSLDREMTKPKLFSIVRKKKGGGEINDTSGNNREWCKPLLGDTVECTRKVQRRGRTKCLEVQPCKRGFGRVGSEYVSSNALTEQRRGGGEGGKQNVHHFGRRRP